MAVVFISPKQRQRMFFLGITVVFLLFMIVAFLGIFFAGPKTVPSVLVFNKPKVNIDMKIFNSDQFKSLQPFVQMQIQYTYTATDKNNKAVSGFIAASSVEDARQRLQSSGLDASEIKEAEIGRDNPFIPYYQQAVIPNPALATAGRTVTR